MFVMQPHIMQNMVAFIFPIAWKIFSKARPTPMMGANRNARLE